jgi:hypothetical protein
LTDHHCPQIAELMTPQGRFEPIDDLQPLGLKLLIKGRPGAWQNMFARSAFQTEGVEAQHDLLTPYCR